MLFYKENVEWSLMSNLLQGPEGTEVRQRLVLVPDLLIPEENRSV